MEPKPAIDAAVFCLNTSAWSLNVWLAAHYLKGEFPLQVGPWRLVPPRPKGMPRASRMDVVAVPSLTAGQDGRLTEGVQAGEPVLRFDVIDIGTLRDARVEVVAVCLSPSLPLRVHFYGVLSAIAVTWPEAAAEIDTVRHTFALEVGEEAARLSPAPGKPRPRQVPPWLRIPDIGWDRRAVELLHQGLSHAEIAGRAGKDVVAKTVCNRLSQLRILYGEEIVPKRPRRVPKIP